MGLTRALAPPDFPDLTARNGQTLEDIAGSFQPFLSGPLDVPPACAVAAACSNPSAKVELETSTVATRRERLSFKFWQIIEGEAEGRFAICALVGIVAGTLL